MFLFLLAACHRHPRPNADPNAPEAASRPSRQKDRLPTNERANGGGELDQRLDELAAGIGAKLSRDDHLAVSDFPDLDNKPSDLGKHIAEELSTRLIEQGKAHIVERSHWQQVVKEQRLGASQAIDDESAARIGKMIGANLICTGTVSDLGATVKVNARVINTSTGEVIAASSVILSRTGPVARLLDGKILSAPEQPAMQQRLLVYTKKAPAGWEKAALIVVNHASWCLRLRVGAEELRVFDKTGETPCITAGEKAYVTIPAYGEYAIMAMGSNYPNPFREVARYEKVFYFSKSSRTLELRDSDFHGLR